MPVYKRTEQFALFMIHLFLFAAAVACIVPFIMIISASFTDSNAISIYGYSLIPRVFSALAYKYILINPLQIFQAYKITVIVTCVGTAASIIVSSCYAYVLSRKDFPFRGQLSVFLFFTMLFNGGLVPNYILVSHGLHLGDTIWALILPYLIIPFNILLLRTFFSEIPYSLIESAKIEGCGEFGILVRVVMPLSLPAIATVGLFIILTYWNDWYLALLYITSSKLSPIQYMLYNIMQSLDAISRIPGQAMTQEQPGENVRMAIAVLATGPVIFAFAFVQKYFVSGLTVGAIKG